ncbi:TPA: pilus assembly protein PilM [Candidatus Saccharibacteria bacterium]|nr:MAG: Cell division protein FtsA [Candidatus Saccharibacteria bacterium GW2011_GWC2_44_17]MBH1956796.1 pilus assembly protein PilM [Candidatus Saccharibacteria bacterium]OGL24172.1 MAG: pilus assembly protein PilM [Candidatus Saccharibacteria bacterium RIFCSPHIGHO2_01_FULL_46_30]OGL33840.1 MAG: pilus assembly protein PilM [Candidatus Saccharibacteria bacterium RIFCSPHIGHO2_12_FULL_47_16]MBH1973416.1 pilus assembly protein PilM [Candidatus Saccharibacteria bacterium]
MSKLFYRDKPIIGLDISSTDMKVMSIDLKRKAVSGYGTIDLDPLRIKKAFDEEDDYLTENLHNLLESKLVGELQSDQVVLGIPTSRTFSRTFTLPVSAESTLKDAVSIEVGQYIPIPLSLLYVDYEIIERNEKQLTVVMSAVPKRLIDNTIAACEAAGLTVNMVEPAINAVARVLKLTEEGHLPTVIVDIGAANTDIAVLDGSVRVTGGIATGGNTFTLDIAKKLSVTLENAHQLKVLNGLAPGARQEKLTAALRPSLRGIITETRKVIRYYNERLSNDRRLEQVLVVGSGSNIPGIGEYFTNELVMPARTANPWQELDFGELPQPAKQFRSRYISVAGLSNVEKGAMWQ